MIRSGTFLFLCLFAFLHFIFPSTAFSQEPSQDQFTPAIEDNSMFIEEAYNQEDRVVQHISNLVFTPNLKDNFFYAFTQEWPAFGLNHQLSYTLQYTSLQKGASAGFGDIMLNYRYQALYKDDPVCFSPRMSLIIPTGNKDKGLGTGSWGLQINLPFSKRWSNQFINHFNAGSTYLFRVKDESLNFDKPVVSYFMGLSSIWLVNEKFNLMLECLANFNSTPGMDNKITHDVSAIVAPAFRYAIDIRDLQIVPGLSVPITFTKDQKAETGAFVYLSFEHPF